MLIDYDATYVTPGNHMTIAAHGPDAFSLDFLPRGFETVSNMVGADCELKVARHEPRSIHWCNS